MEISFQPCEIQSFVCAVKDTKSPIMSTKNHIIPKSCPPASCRMKWPLNRQCHMKKSAAGWRPPAWPCELLLIRSWTPLCRHWIIFRKSYWSPCYCLNIVVGIHFSTLKGKFYFNIKPECNILISLFQFICWLLFCGCFSLLVIFSATKNMIICFLHVNNISFWLFRFQLQANLFSYRRQKE